MKLNKITPYNLTRVHNFLIVLYFLKINGKLNHFDHQYIVTYNVIFNLILLNINLEFNNHTHSCNYNDN